MRYGGSKNQLFIALLGCLLWVASSGCVQREGEAPTTVVPTAEIEVPREVLEAREAVLDFLRRGANECVPPAGVHWRAAAGKAPRGFSVYRFHAEACTMTVSYPVAAEEPLYHVALHSGDSGFCWQANVNAHARVVDTGTAAELFAELAEVSAAYCRAQGFAHAVQEQPDGSRCGVCTFPDGSQCKAWLFYQGECGPAGEAFIP
jgi:putative hemolysin